MLRTSFQTHRAPHARIPRRNALNKISSAGQIPPDVLPIPGDYSTQDINANATRVYRPTYSANSNLKGPKAGRSCTNGNGAEIFRSVAPTAPVTPVPPTQHQGEEDRTEENVWMKYVDPSPKLFVRGTFTCLWQENLHDGTSKPCGYYSNKHVIKRHIKSKHLKLRCASAQPGILHSVSRRVTFCLIYTQATQVPVLRERLFPKKQPRHSP